MSLVEIILAVLLPPVAVILRKGLGTAFFINLLLTILGIIPGIIHAFYLLTRE